ncbi:MAG: PH domain-containing protein [Actinomycetota bacterium]|nr:PH domain-containing protein [Actinomycetota bacterium]MDA8207399.1 PH domain-containing protein [Actinomycetota bacterium]
MLGRLRRYSVGEDEEVVARARQHFVVLVWPIALMLVVAIADVAAIFVYPWLPIMIKIAGLVALIACAFYYVAAYLRYRSLEVVVTSTRVVYLAGVVSTSRREIPLDRIAEIGVQASLAQRLLGMGTLRISSSGDDPDLLIPAIAEPAEVSRALNAAIEARRRPARGSTGASAAPAAKDSESPLDKIAALGDLYKRGLLSKEEFEVAKAELLRRL